MSKQKPKQQELKESCGKCGSDDFAIGRDAGQYRYCSKCSNVWGPMSMDLLKVKASEADIAEARAYNKRMQKDLDALSAENASLKDKLALLETKAKPQTDMFD